MADEPDDGLTEAERKFMQTRGASGLPDQPEEPAAAPPEEATETTPGPAETAAEAPAEGSQPPAGAAPPEEEEDVEPPVDPATGKKPPKHVNWNRFKRMQDRYDEANKELNLTRSEMAQLKETVSRADERMKIINEALAQPTQEQQDASDEDPAPDPKEDIFGYLAWQGRETTRMFERLNERVEGITEHVSTQASTNDLVGSYRRDANEYALREPQFGAAYAHLIRTRLEQLEAAGVENPRERERIVVDEERALVEQSYQSRINPAERIFRVAKAYGFNPASAPPASAAPSAQAPAAPAPASPGAATPKPNVGAEIDAARAGQGAAFSLSQAGGAPPPSLTPEVLANMDEEDFGKLMDKLSPKEMRRLLPGA